MPDRQRVLTPDDVAKRLDRALMRAWTILLDVRQEPGLYDAVRRSRHFTNAHEELAKELAIWRGGGADDLPG
jgi:hypothetical protein